MYIYHLHSILSSLDHMSSSIFENMPVPRLFWHCVLPVSVSMLCASIYIVIDGMFVGHYMGHESLAAISLMWPLLAVCFSLGDLITSGSSVQIGIYLGRHDKEKAGRIFTVCTLAIFLLATLAGTACYFFTDDFLYLLGADAKTTALGISYTKSYCFFMPMVTLFYTVNGYLRLCGFQKYSMYINIFVSLLNLILDYIFIAVLRQGVWSASFTTCVSMTVGTLIGAFPFVFKKTELQFILGGFSSKIFYRMLFNGSSTFLTTNSWSVLQLCFNAMLLQLGGSLAVGATAAVMYLNSVISMLLMGMAQALQPALSYCYGAKLFERVYRINRKVLLTSGIFSVLSCVILELFGDYVVPFYAQDGDYAFMEMMKLCLRIIAISFLVNWIETCLDVYLTALDSPGRSFVVSMCRTLIFPIAFLYICAPIFGLIGIWLSPTFAGVASAIVSIYAAKSLWKEKMKQYQTVEV